MMKPVWWSLSSHHTLLLTRGWGLVIIEFSPHLSSHERVRSGDHWVLATSFSSREGEVWWSLSSRHILFLTRGWGLVIIEFSPHPFPHERVRSGDHWVLATPFSSREGEVWWSLSSHHILLLTRGWGLVIIEFSPHPSPHERVGFVHETSVRMYYVERFVHSISPPRIQYMKFTTMGIFTGKLSLT